jgi:hypothetical protein
VFPVVLRLPQLADRTRVERAAVLLIRPDGREEAVGGVDDAALGALLRDRRAEITVRLPAEQRDEARLVGEVRAIDAAGRAARPRSETLTVPLPAMPALSAIGRYFTLEGEQIGRGPLPPAVGERTEYWIFWNIAPIARDIRRLEIRARLPAGISWTGKQTVGIPDAPPVSYLPSTREVRWIVRGIDAAVAEAGIGAGFAISYLPVEGARGDAATLVAPTSATIVTADGATSEIVAPAVTTALPEDARAAGKGIVE